MPKIASGEIIELIQTGENVNIEFKLEICYKQSFVYNKFPVLRLIKN